MKAMLVVKVGNGYAVAPFCGEVPSSFVADMQIAECLHSYSYGNSVEKVMKAHFEPEPKAAPEVIPVPEATETAAPASEMF